MKKILLLSCALIAIPCFCQESKKIAELKEKYKRTSPHYFYHRFGKVNKTMPKETKEIEKKKKKEEKEKYGLAFTLKNGYFYPQEKVLRSIFDRKGSKGGYWIEGALRYNFWKGLNVEASGSYFKRSGYALCCPVTCNTNCYNVSCCNTAFNNCCCGCECTEVKIPTFGLGLKYFWEWCDWCQLFIGAGLRIFFYREKNSSPYVIPRVNKTTAGGMVNAGIEFDVYKDFFIDLFIDYNFSKLNNCCKLCYYPCGTGCNPCDSCCPSCCFDIKLGGVVFGIGLGYKF